MTRPICPSCGMELRIGPTFDRVEQGEAYTVQQMMCANPKCGYNRAGAPVKVIRHRLQTGSMDDDNKLCCDGLIARITDTAFFVPETVEHTETDSVLSVVCPLCGKRHEFDITGKSRIQ